MDALPVGIRELRADFVGAAYVERWQAQSQNVRIGLLRDDFCGSELLPYHVHVFRLRPTTTNHAHFYAAACGSIEQIQRLPPARVPGAKSGDGFKNVAAANARLFRGALPQNGDHDDLAEAFAEVEPGFARSGALQFLF